MIDWRANRLVDLLAKIGASANAPSNDTQKLLKSTAILVKHMAAQLGEATHHANNCTLMVAQEDGTVVEKVCRDSTPKPKRVNVNPSPLPTPLPAKPRKPKPVGGKVKAWSPEQAPDKRRRVTVQNRKRATERQIVDAAAMEWRAPAPMHDELHTSWKETAVGRISKRLKVSEAIAVPHDPDDTEVEPSPPNNGLSLITINYMGPIGERGSGDGAVSCRPAPPVPFPKGRHHAAR